jgi:hypothetical protein
VTATSLGGVSAWVTPLVAALGVVLGAAATGFATVVAANRKVREVELAFLQRLQENYLENARAYTQGVYMPIATALTRLSAEFGKYQSELEASNESAPAVARFYEAVGSFTEVVKDLQDRGAAAFLTTALEGELEDFIAFLEASHDATTTKRRATVRLSIFGMSIEGALSSPTAIQQARLMSTLRYLPALFMPRVKVLKDHVVAADPLSDVFNMEFVLSVNRLRVLIKEVTLGAHASR